MCAQTALGKYHHDYKSKQAASDMLCKTSVLTEPVERFARCAALPLPTARLFDP